MYIYITSQSCGSFWFQHSYSWWPTTHIFPLVHCPHQRELIQRLFSWASAPRAARRTSTSERRSCVGDRSVENNLRLAVLWRKHFRESVPLIFSLSSKHANKTNGNGSGSNDQNETANRIIRDDFSRPDQPMKRNPFIPHHIYQYYTFYILIYP